MLKIFRWQFAFLLVSLFVLAACSPATANQLPSTSWVLVSLDGNTEVGEAIGGQAVTLIFTSDTEVGGSGGCNSFGGQYTVTGNAITFSEIVSTLMACTDQGIGEVESAYFAALDAADSYALAAGSLTITGGGHTLVFERA